MPDTNNSLSHTCMRYFNLSKHQHVLVFLILMIPDLSRYESNHYLLIL